MGRRDHKPRFDTTQCPNPEECERVYHGIGGPDLGDTCECCGVTVAYTEGIDSVISSLADLGVHAEPLRGGPAINVFRGGFPRGIAHTVWAPDGNRGWVWGDNWQFSLADAATAQDVAAQVVATIRPRLDG
jgi:hypothetical protein